MKLASVFITAAVMVSPIATVTAAAQAAQQPAVATEVVQANAVVQVDEVPSDNEITERLTRIYEATQWYRDLAVRVEEGVVFLGGVCSAEDHCVWATSLASRTEGVVGVANQMTTDEQLIWSFEPAWQTIRELARDIVQRLPLIVLSLIVLAITWLLSVVTRRLAGSILARRLENRILLQIATTLSILPVALIGIYVFLQVAGLSRLAATVLGGTGLVGLVVGIAFRDIAENFLASLLISIKRPFRIGHLIAIDDTKGFVQSVTTRGTLLMTLEGNHIHVPNSRIYKSTLYNYSANPRSRFDFAIGIDYGDSTAHAQEVCLEVLQSHPAVLDDPEPLVLLEGLGSSSVNLRVYFWVNVREHSGLKVRSSVIRKIKVAIEQAGLTMPDDAREVIFPRPVPIVMQASGEQAVAPATAIDEARSAARASAAAADSETTTEAEGDLSSESHDIRQQAEGSDDLGLGPNILEQDDNDLESDNRSGG